VSSGDGEGRGGVGDAALDTFSWYREFVVGECATFYVAAVHKIRKNGVCTQRMQRTQWVNASPDLLFLYFGDKAKLPDQKTKQWRLKNKIKNLGACCPYACDWMLAFGSHVCVYNFESRVYKKKGEILFCLEVRLFWLLQQVDLFESARAKKFIHWRQAKKLSENKQKNNFRDLQIKV
jgi:hypothetical protein